MYLAIRWLIFLGLVMWGLLCCFDLFIKRKAKFFSEGPSIDVRESIPEVDSTKFLDGHRQNVVFLNYFTFVAGALAVILYNKKKDIIQYTKEKITTVEFRLNSERVISHLNKTALFVNVAIFKILPLLWEKIKRKVVEHKENKPNERIDTLLKRIREIGMERNKLGQLLVAAIQENKNIRLQYQIESLAKKRLVHQVQATQEIIKENRSKYANFQQMYVVTHQENIFLKMRIKKLVKDKEEAEANLMTLLSRVDHSNDSYLKAYCTCFITRKNKKNVLATDSEAATSPLHVSSSTSTHKSFLGKAVAVNTTQSEPINMNLIIDKKTHSNPYVPEEPKPKLRGLPGEYVWTVKDKDGIIEKLYEYDYGFNYDNGDTIRRIREYSVYHDKDCLLDIVNSNSTTIVCDYVPAPGNSSRSSPRQSCSNISSNKKFLTDSPVFKNFMRSRTELLKPQPSRPLLCS